MKFEYESYVFMSRNNGQLVVGLPLYLKAKCETEKFKIGITVQEDQPVAYAIDCGPEIEKIQFFNAPWVEEHLESLGEL